MTKLEWGTKRVCQSCEARFFDLRKSPIICPKCNEEYELPKALKAVAVPDKKKKATTKTKEDPVAAEEIKIAELDGAETTDDGLIEDTSDLGDEMDDVAVVATPAPDEDVEEK